MLRIGIISVSTDVVRSCGVRIKIEPTAYAHIYKVNNHIDIPFNDRQGLDSGATVAGVFNVIEGDQFATYIPIERICIKK